MKPYPETAGTTTNQKNYNYRQSRARMVVENSFGRLEGRWRCLLKRLDVKLENIPSIVAACVVLHNLCKVFGDNCLQEWTSNEDVQEPTSGATAGSTHTGNNIRDAIMQHLATS